MAVENLQETPLQVVKKLFLASFLMCSMPIIAYFASKKYLFEDFLQYSANSSNLLAVIPAVIAVNFVIGLYVYLAWHSEPFRDKIEEVKKEE